MKKNVKVLICTILLLCLIVCLSFIIILKNKQTTCDDFELDDILYEINLATNNYFLSLEEGEDTSSYFPIPFNQNKKHISAFNLNDEDEYFLLIENISSDEKEKLKKFIENSINKEKNIKFEEYGKYTYIISTTDYTSIIDGIIRSYIYCQ